MRSSASAARMRDSLFGVPGPGCRPQQPTASGEALPNPPWIIEGPPAILSHNRKLAGGMTTLVVSRYSLVSTMCLTSTVLLCHLLATKWIRRPHQFPKSNWAKLRSFTAFASVVAVALEAVKDAAAFYGFPLWSNLARWEVITAALFFQANLYTISRLARKSFTLGELGIVASTGVTLTMETLHLFVAKLLPVTTPYVKTFRRPTPLLIFQLALIVGTFMVGFCSRRCCTCHATWRRSPHIDCDGPTSATCIGDCSQPSSICSPPSMWWACWVCGCAGCSSSAIRGCGPCHLCSRAPGHGRGPCS